MVDLDPEEVRLIPLFSNNRREDPANRNVLKNGVLAFQRSLDLGSNSVAPPVPKLSTSLTMRQKCGVTLRRLAHSFFRNLRPKAANTKTMPIFAISRSQK